MVFGDKEMIKYLQSSPSWLADGTFKLSPKMFYQLYTVHIQGSGIAPACVYGFLPNKTESTHERFLDILLSLLPNAAPDKVLIDLELAAMKAFEKALPNATISGCFLHLSQIFIRKIGELGLKRTCTIPTQSCRWLGKLYQLWLLKSLKMLNPPSSSSLKILKKHASRSPSTKVK